MNSENKDIEFVDICGGPGNRPLKQECPLIGQTDVQVEQEQSQSYDENTVRELAYFRWLAATNGNPVDQEQEKNFWIEAEQELKSQYN